MTRHPWIAAALAVTAACGGANDAADTARAPREIRVTRVVAPAPLNVGGLSQSTMSVYATITNDGATEDSLVGVETLAARSATLHATMVHDGMAMMSPTSGLAVPPGATVRLAPGGTHVMLEGIARQFAAGDSVALTLRFRRAGDIPVVAGVVAYEDVQKTLTP